MRVFATEMIYWGQEQTGGAILDDRKVIISVINSSCVLLITWAFGRVSRREARPCHPAPLQGQKMLN